jgi:NodT family efflux transporter outer membrane factor (OMF) lipoprotein
MRLPLVLAFSVAGLLAGGCVTQAPSVVSMPDLPAQWQHASATDSVTTNWWRSFGSEELNRLVRQAQRESLDMAAAVARVRQALASARMARAVLVPDVALAAQSGRGGGLAGEEGDDDAYRMGLSANFEVDFWGRNRAIREGAVASLEASRFDRDTVQLTVTAGVATAWLNAVALWERRDIAEQNLQAAERLLALVEVRERAGAATGLELAQQRGLVAGQRRELNRLRTQAEDARTMLGVLLAEASVIRIEQTTLAALNVPDIGVGLPSDLLVRRPDIARAEAQLAAADANVARARAAMLPSMTLIGGIGTTGNAPGGVLDNPAYSVVAALAAPIFRGGRLSAEKDLALAEREELLAGYRATIITAFADVTLALNAVQSAQVQARLQSEQRNEAQHALILAEARYRVGAESLLTLLDAQRALYDAEDAAVQVRLSQLLAAVGLYKALGGGWSGSSA